MEYILFLTRQQVLWEVKYGLLIYLSTQEKPADFNVANLVFGY